MVGEKALFKTVKFIKSQEVKPGEWLYAQEGEPAKPVTMDDLYKALQPKLVEQIEAQITQAGPFYNLMKKKGQEATLAQVVSWTLVNMTMTDKEILAICEKHKTDHGYSSLMEQRMATLGYNTPPTTGEEPYTYLSRLLEIAKVEEQKQAFTKALGEYETLKKEYEAQQKAAQQAKAQLQQYNNPQIQQWPSSGAMWSTTGIQQGPLLGDSISAPMSVPPKAEEKPRPRLPEPIEPRKRLMKKA